MITNNGKAQMALGLATGSFAVPFMCDIGTGSATVSVNTSGLQTPVQTTIFTSVDTTVTRQISYIADFSSVTMSGITLTEFGLRSSGGPIGSGIFFNVEPLTPTVYTGGNELEIQITYKIL